MNEASLWRHALAQKLAPHYSVNPKVAAIRAFRSTRKSRKKEKGAILSFNREI